MEGTIPTKCNSPNTYTINNDVDTLVLEYSEEEVMAVEPNFFKHIQGCHHIDSKNNITVFDYTKFGKYNN